jgi:hypothetical protein
LVTIIGSGGSFTCPGNGSLYLGRPLLSREGVVRAEVAWGAGVWVRVEFFCCAGPSKGEGVVSPDLARPLGGGGGGSWRVEFCYYSA